MPRERARETRPPRRHAAVRPWVFLLLWVAGAGALASPQTHTVVIEGTAFSPPVVEAHVGDTIVWKNKDFFPHTATADDHRFDSGPIGANRSWKWKVRKKGESAYICTLHPTMKARVIVK